MKINGRSNLLKRKKLSELSWLFDKSIQTSTSEIMTEIRRNIIHGFRFKLLIPTNHVSSNAMPPMTNRVTISIPSVKPAGKLGLPPSALIFLGSGDQVSEFGVSKKANDIKIVIGIQRNHFATIEL